MPAPVTTPTKLKCPNNHTLIQMELNNKNFKKMTFSCDKCRKTIAFKQDVMYSCRRCNWDLCKSCFQHKWHVFNDKTRYPQDLETNPEYPWNIFNDDILNRFFYYTDSTTHTNEKYSIVNYTMIDKVLPDVMQKLVDDTLFVQLERECSFDHYEQLLCFVIDSFLTSLKCIFDYIDGIIIYLQDKEHLVGDDLRTSFNCDSQKCIFRSLAVVCKDCLEILCKRCDNSKIKRKLVEFESKAYGHLFLPSL